jgi:hypothetical protein
MIGSIGRQYDHDVDGDDCFIDFLFYLVWASRGCASRCPPGPRVDESCRRRGSPSRPCFLQGEELALHRPSRSLVASEGLDSSGPRRGASEALKRRMYHLVNSLSVMR